MTNRSIEKIIASAISIIAVIWFLAGNRTISTPAANGLMYGVIAPSFLTMLGLSVSVEGLLLTAITVLIGVEYGITGVGMSLLGYALFALALTAALTLGNYIRKA